MDNHEQNVSRMHPGPAASSVSSLEMEASRAKFSFKIKIPNSKPSIDEEGSAAPDLDQHAAGYRVCEYCGKEFSSGKAWGGHKRHHLKNERDLKQAKKLELAKSHHDKLKKHDSELVKGKGCNTIKAGDVSVGNNGKPTCCLCGKVFPSMNSLFGHMRFHPDRGWKGTQPPSSHNSSSSPPEARGAEVRGLEVDDEKDLDHGVDLLTSLSSWTKTDKRGRIVLDPMPEAALNLIKLSRHSGGLEKKDMKLNSKETNTNVTATEPFQQKERHVQMDFRENEEAFDCDWEDSDSPNEDQIGKRKAFSEMVDETHRKMTKKNKKLLMDWVGKLNDSETQEGTVSSYGKSFPTAASGSHGPSSLANVNRSELVDYNYTMDVKSHLVSDSEVKPEEIEENISSFQCDICHKTFPTGQALGGHKRCHWKGPVKAPSNEFSLLGRASQISSTTGSSGEANQAVANDCSLGFDLNEPYIMEDGD